MKLTEINPQALSEDRDAYLDMCSRNQRMHCYCGRFVSVKAVTHHGMDVRGSRRWTWTCSRCGEQEARS